MAARRMKPWVLVIGDADWRRLHHHHYPGDDDEHGSVLLCGIAETDRERRLLVRTVQPAKAGVDYVPSTTAYRALSPDFVSAMAGRADAERLVYCAVHSHFSDETVGFSRVDLASQRRGHGALVDITRGPVAWLVLGLRSAAGLVWTRDGAEPIDHVLVVGASMRRVMAAPPKSNDARSAIYDRQMRIFGEDGQQVLGRLRVGVVGVGGAGSIVALHLIHLGIRDLVLVDPDRIGRENLPRNVGALPSDAPGALLQIGSLKVDTVERLVRPIAPDAHIERLATSIAHPDAVTALLSCDAIFLAADSATARYVVNAICHQYLIPGFQMGAKVTADEAGCVADVFAVSRIIVSEGSCLWCDGLVDRSRMALEALPEAERRAADYAGQVAAPSVITMNAMSTALALNDFLFMFVGLHAPDTTTTERFYFLQRRELLATAPRAPSTSCVECCGRRAYGDRAELPVRRTRAKSHVDEHADCPAP